MGGTKAFRQGFGYDDDRYDPDCNEAYRWGGYAGDAYDLLNPKGWAKNGYQLGVKQFGSYTHWFKSGKRYHGKGPPERARQTAREKAGKHDDPHVRTDWTESPNERQSYIDEHNRLSADRGPRDPDNYNQRNSPGAKF